MEKYKTKFVIDAFDFVEWHLSHSVDSHITHGSTSPVYLSLLVVGVSVSLVADAGGGDEERGKYSPVESEATHQQRVRRHRHSPRFMSRK